MIAIVGDLKSGDFIVESIDAALEDSVAQSAELARKMKAICAEKGINFYQ